MLPCDGLLSRIPYVGVQNRLGPWLKYEIDEMRKLIEIHEEAFGICHPDEGYLDMIDTVFVEHYVENCRPTVTLRMMLSFVPVEKRTAERDIELLRQFSTWYGWEQCEE
jgi:hypothetical protein